MQRTKIDWVKNSDGTQGYSWNPLVGCENNCPYCYARRIATRFKGTKAFPDGFKPTFHPDRLSEPVKLKKPSMIFVCSMGELFGPWVKKDWVEQIFSVIHCCPRHTFQILTKFPENIPQPRTNIWGRHDVYMSLNYPSMPSNVWLGITITGKESPKEQTLMLASLEKINARVRFISFEPLLNMPFAYSGYLNIANWLIIGGLTPQNTHKKEWIDKILENADKFGIPVFIKKNAHYPIIRKEFPLEGKTA